MIPPMVCHIAVALISLLEPAGLTRPGPLVPIGRGFPGGLLDPPGTLHLLVDPTIFRRIVLELKFISELLDPVQNGFFGAFGHLSYLSLVDVT
jgi:hypothetical protein